MNIALIVFAGNGSRIHSELPKQFIKINDIEMVVYTIKKLNDNPHIDEIVLVTSKEFIPYVEEFKDKYELRKIVKVVEGGTSRQESVRLGLSSLEYNEKDNILIHDGDRPLVSNSVINQCISYLDEFEACCPYLLETDEIQEISNSGRKIELNGVKVDIQTPQGFKFQLIKDKHFEKASLQVNDDISLVDPSKVKFFVGEPINFKVTTDGDLQYLKSHLLEYEQI